MKTLKFKIKEYKVTSDSSYNANLYAGDDRYVVVQSDGSIVDGQHYSLLEAQNKLNELTK